MIKTIWKYQLQIDSRQIIEMPIGAKILTIQMQGGAPCLWVLVAPHAGTTPRLIKTFGTGQNIIYPDSMVYIGTYQLHKDDLVFHVFEEL